MEAPLYSYTAFKTDLETHEEREISSESGADAIAELTKNAACGIIYRDENQQTRYKGLFDKRVGA